MMLQAVLVRHRAGVGLACILWNFIIVLLFMYLRTIVFIGLWICILVLELKVINSDELINVLNFSRVFEKGS